MHISLASQDLDRITSPERDFHASIQFVYYVQYQLHRQLLSVSQYAAQHQIVLKGDLPIGTPLCTPSSLCAYGITSPAVLKHPQTDFCPHETT